MKTVILVCTVVACMASGARAESEITSEPIRLTESQMDSVTAGRLDLSVTALATALGPNSIADTDTNVTVFKRGRVEIGFGIGKAFACCGPDSETAVLTEGSADGRIVFIRKRVFVNDTPQFSQTVGTILIVSVNKPEDLTRANGL